MARQKSRAELRLEFAASTALNMGFFKMTTTGSRGVDLVVLNVLRSTSLTSGDALIGEGPTHVPPVPAEHRHIPEREKWPKIRPDRGMSKV
jgi:hypothetical protein